MNKEKYLKAELWLIIENNSSYVRGKKKAIQIIELFILSDFEYEKNSTNDGTYTLAIPYKSKKELDETVKELIYQIYNKADLYNTFVVDCIITDKSDEDCFWE